LVADADFDGTGGKLVCGWFYAQGWGESNVPRFLNDGKLIANLATTRVAISRNGGVTTIYSGAASVSLNKWIFFAYITESDGITNIYIGDEDTTPVLSGSADQDAGTPADGGDLYIGNRSENNRTFEGAIHGLKIWDLDEITMSPEDLLQTYYRSTK